VVESSQSVTELQLKCKAALLFKVYGYTLFKGLVHPKMKIKSLITHPHAVPTP